MKADDPAALRFLMQDDIYLLNSEKALFKRDEPEIIEEEISPIFKFMGGNLKNFLVTVCYTKHEYMPAGHLAALENTLKRVGFSMDDIAIVNLAHNNNAAIEALNDFFKPVKLLIAGKNAMPQNIPPLTLNQPEFTGNIKVLYTFSFDEMMDSNENKKAFWEQVKIL